MSKVGANSDTGAVGFVLAGGRSSRMGTDKALVPFAGRPLIVHALEILRQAGLSASIAGARLPLDEYAPVVADAQPDRGPLGGICAALTSTMAEFAVFLPVDMPLLPASLIVYLLHHALITGRAVTLASVNGFAQSFPAVVCWSALPVLQAELEAGRGGCFAAFQAAASSRNEPVSVVPVELLVQTGQVSSSLPAVRWFLNLNTGLDLQRAQAFHPARIG